MLINGYCAALTTVKSQLQTEKLPLALGILCRGEKRVYLADPLLPQQAAISYHPVVDCQSVPWCPYIQSGDMDPALVLMLALWTTGTCRCRSCRDHLSHREE